MLRLSDNPEAKKAFLQKRAEACKRSRAKKKQQKEENNKKNEIAPEEIPKKSLEKTAAHSPDDAK